jgi:hypothetical protein
MDALRLAVGEVEAIAAVLLAWFDSSDWSGVDSQLVDRTGHVLGVLAESATRAVGKFERFEIAFVDAQPVPAGEAFDYSDGTAPGSEEAMSEPDAVIVQRIRMRCPDRRFEGSSDVELLQLFKRNKRVLNRSDEDVIAAMTPPR